MTGHLYYWVADWNLSRAEAVQRLGGAHQVGNMVDCTGAAFDVCRATNAERMAGYVTGSEGVAWTPAQFALAAANEPGRNQRAVLRIDQSDSDLPLISEAKVAKDIEPGASGDPVAVEVAKQRLAAGDDYTLYTSSGNMQALEDAVAAAGLPPGEIVAYQWASPSSNPGTLLPGTALTIKQAGADLSVVKSSWLPLPHQAAKNHGSPAHKHSLARANVTAPGGDTAEVQVDLDNMKWDIVKGTQGWHVHSAHWGD